MLGGVVGTKGRAQLIEETFCMGMILTSVDSPGASNHGIKRAGPVRCMGRSVFIRPKHAGCVAHCWRSVYGSNAGRRPTSRSRDPECENVPEHEVFLTVMYMCSVEPSVLAYLSCSGHSPEHVSAIFGVQAFTPEHPLSVVFRRFVNSSTFYVQLFSCTIVI